MIIKIAAVGTVALTIGTGLAQTTQPYAGFQHRSIKALSDQQMADLRAGRGMGLALAAELNGYPGPLHVLDLADALSLSSQQRVRVRELYDAMKAETIPLGETLISQEAALDRLFADRTATPTTLADATAAIGRTEGTLRFAHLKYHLAAIEILSAYQLRRYAELRGYANGDRSTPLHHHSGAGVADSPTPGSSR